MITDEMVEKAEVTFLNAGGLNGMERYGLRAALEAVAPMLRAQGLWEAVAICDGEPEVAAYEAAIRKRAQELDPQ